MLRANHLIGFGAGGSSIGTASSYPLNGLSGVTAAWSPSRKLLSAWGGSLYTLSGGDIATILDQTGNSRDFSDSAALTLPALSTAGTNGRACADFDGVNDVLQVDTVALSNFISNTTGYILATAIIDAITTNAANIESNDCLFSDNGGNFGFHFKNGGGATYTGHGYNWDGNRDVTTHASFPLGSLVVCEWWHESGTVWSRINKGTKQSAASGNSTVTSTLQLMRASVASVRTDGKFFEMFTANVVPSDPVKDALVDDFTLWPGA
jgi:hypothetical protein